MKKFLMEIAFALLMNALNLLIYGFYLLSHTMYLSWVLFLLDVIGLKVSFDMVKEKEEMASSVVSLILFGIALLGAVGLTVMGLSGMFGGFQ